MDATALETGGLFVIAIGLIEIIKGLIKKRSNDKNGEKSALTQEQTHQLQSLYDLHDRIDGDGTPLWYVPRSWGETQKDIADSLKEVSNTQKTQTEILKKIVEQIS